MYLVGLTGGIGSGKSTVARIFKFLGIPVFDADKEAKQLYSNDQVKDKVRSEFGPNVFERGEIAFSKLSEIVFRESLKLEKLESILYPKLAVRFEEWKKENSESPYLIKEAAVMLEKGTYKDLDAIILITAPEEMRIERVMNRNESSREFVESRMKNQWTDEKKSRYVDYIIKNDQTSSLLKQVIDLHERILIQASSKRVANSH